MLPVPIVTASLVLLLASPAALPMQEPPKPAASAASAEDPYPPARPATVVRFFSLAGDLDRAAVDEALEALETKEGVCRIVCGPREVATRKRRNFLAVELSPSIGSRAVVAALRRGVREVDELEWTVFHQPRLDEVPELRWSIEFLLIPLPNEVRWADAYGGRAQFYSVPGGVDPRKIVDQYENTMRRTSGVDLGPYLRESFEWELAEPVGAEAAGRARKTIAKIPGVREVGIDPVARRISVTVELARLRSSGPPVPFAPIASPPSNAKATEVRGQRVWPIVRACFDTTPVFDALAAEKLAVVAR